MNDDFYAFSEINYPLTILVKHLQCGENAEDVQLSPILGNGVILFSNPHKHPRVIAGICQFMGIYVTCGVCQVLIHVLEKNKRNIFETIFR